MNKRQHDTLFGILCLVAVIIVVVGGIWKVIESGLLTSVWSWYTSLSGSSILVVSGLALLALSVVVGILTAHLCPHEDQYLDNYNPDRYNPDEDH